MWLLVQINYYLYQQEVIYGSAGSPIANFRYDLELSSAITGRSHHDQMSIDQFQGYRDTVLVRFLVLW